MFKNDHKSIQVLNSTTKKRIISLQLPLNSFATCFEIDSDKLQYVFFNDHHRLFVMHTPSRKVLSVLVDFPELHVLPLLICCITFDQANSELYLAYCMERDEMPQHDEPIELKNYVLRLKVDMAKWETTVLFALEGRVV